MISLWEAMKCVVTMGKEAPVVFMLKEDGIMLQWKDIQVQVPNCRDLKVEEISELIMDEQVQSVLSGEGA
jgi:hypothetical protein